MRIASIFDAMRLEYTPFSGITSLWGVAQMASLFFAVYFLVQAACDLLDLKILSGSVRSLPRDKQKTYRRWRGAILLVLAGVAGYVFYLERILGNRYTFEDALLWIALPYAVPVMGLLALNYSYRLWPFSKNEKP